MKRNLVDWKSAIIEKEVNNLYYIKYNDVDLTQMVKVREISLPSLPEIEHDSIDLWEMDGNIFNSVSYGNRVINLRFLIQPLDPNELEVLTQDVKRVFYTREPKELYIGSETKYMLCVPEGEVVVTELGIPNAVKSAFVTATAVVTCPSALVAILYNPDANSAPLA